MTRARAKAPQPRYLWDDERGVVERRKNGDYWQAIQLIVGPASYTFRRKCGELLVAALNAKGKR